MHKTIKLCMIGFGNSARELCRLLLERQKWIASSSGYEVEVVAVATKSRGSLLDHRGLDVNELLNLAGREKGFAGHRNSTPLETVDLIKAAHADVLVELSTLSIKDGQPAILHIDTALDCNMQIITANKGPIAWAYQRLKKKADHKGLQLLFESTVMDGTPVFNLVKRTLPDCRIKGFKGILNSTTNYILGEMEKGLSYAEALQKAQDQDFVEADPGLDTRGWDAAAKTAVLINVLMDGNITPVEIDRTGIDGITFFQVEAALVANKRYKLVCEGFWKDGKIVGKVSPQALDFADLFCTVNATSSILCLQTEMMGEISIIENNPEILQTAYGIYSDLLYLMQNASSI